MLDRVFQRYTKTLTKRSPCVLDPSQELRMVLQAILKPIVVGCKADQDTGRAPVARDDDFIFRRLPQILGQIVLNLRQRDLLRSLPDQAYLARRATLALRLS